MPPLTVTLMVPEPTLSLIVPAYLDVPVRVRTAGVAALFVMIAFGLRRVEHSLGETVRAF